ncbi:hypothetical protein HDU97_004564 [Phlyctochytrium planicorne]|nr:hypothetical protein HDU97_004564 [Phlyctochytrium planicorne]
MSLPPNALVEEPLSPSSIKSMFEAAPLAPTPLRSQRVTTARRSSTGPGVDRLVTPPAPLQPSYLHMVHFPPSPPRTPTSGGQDYGALFDIPTAEPIQQPSDPTPVVPQRLESQTDQSPSSERQDMEESKAKPRRYSLPESLVFSRTLNSQRPPLVPQTSTPLQHSTSFSIPSIPAIPPTSLTLLSDPISHANLPIRMSPVPILSDPSTFSEDSFVEPLASDRSDEELAGSSGGRKEWKGKERIGGLVHSASSPSLVTMLSPRGSQSSQDPSRIENHHQQQQQQQQQIAYPDLNGYPDAPYQQPQHQTQIFDAPPIAGSLDDMMMYYGEVVSAAGGDPARLDGWASEFGPPMGRAEPTPVNQGYNFAATLFSPTSPIASGGPGSYFFPDPAPPDAYSASGYQPQQLQSPRDVDRATLALRRAAMAVAQESAYDVAARAYADIGRSNGGGAVRSGGPSGEWEKEAVEMFSGRSWMNWVMGLVNSQGNESDSGRRTDWDGVAEGDLAEGVPVAAFPVESVPNANLVGLGVGSGGRGAGAAASEGTWDRWLLDKEEGGEDFGLGSSQMPNGYTAGVMGVVRTTVSDGGYIPELIESQIHERRRTHPLAIAMAFAVGLFLITCITFPPVLIVGIVVGLAGRDIIRRLQVRGARGGRDSDIVLHLGQWAKGFVFVMPLRIVRGVVGWMRRLVRLVISNVQAGTNRSRARLPI